MDTLSEEPTLSEVVEYAEEEGKDIVILADMGVDTKHGQYMVTQSVEHELKLLAGTDEDIPVNVEEDGQIEMFITFPS